MEEKFKKRKLETNNKKPYYPGLEEILDLEVKNLPTVRVENISGYIGEVEVLEKAALLLIRAYEENKTDVVLECGDYSNYVTLLYYGHGEAPTYTPVSIYPYGDKTKLLFKLVKINSVKSQS